MITIFRHSKPTHLTLLIDRTFFYGTEGTIQRPADLPSRFAHPFRTTICPTHPPLQLNVHYKHSPYMDSPSNFDSLQNGNLNLTKICLELLQYRTGPVCRSGILETFGRTGLVCHPTRFLVVLCFASKVVSSKIFDHPWTQQYSSAYL
ncbi:hypothetical protein BT69DRAFT_1282312 [Atractiella rhizophila]|nr:hypothetical protein BT69DRAFT_1282312 [Atractiella rhizophila]